MAFVHDGAIVESATYDMLTEYKEKSIIKEPESPKSQSTKLSDAAFFSDAEDDSTNTSFTLSDDETSSQGEMSDCKLGDLFIYPITIMLQLRAVCSKTTSSVQYGTRPVAEVCAPQEKPKSSNKHSSKLSLPETSANAWVAQQRASGDLNDDDKVTRSIRGILNKLTVEKFEELYEQLATCGVKTPTQLAILMQEVFDKATQQHHFTEMYADLCMRLEADARLAPARAAHGETDSFSRLLLNQCQDSFQSLLKAAITDESGVEKKKALGNIKLIGLLIVRNMLNSVFLVDSAESMLQEKATNPQVLEALAMLLTVAAPHFDRLDWKHRGRLGSVFANVSDVTRDKTIPARLRFLLQDVLDLRKAGWTDLSHPLTKQEAPMLLEDVRKQADEVAFRSNEKHPSTKSQEEAWQSSSKWSQQGKWECSKSKGWAWIETSDAWQQQVKPQHVASKQQPQGDAWRKNTSKANKWKTKPAKEVAKDTQQKPKEQVKQGVSHENIATTRTECVAPRVESPASSSTENKKFDLVTFRKDLSSMLRELTLDQQQMKTLTPGAAVKRIREHQVPKVHQSGEYSDLLTRAAEERNGAARRMMLALIVGLAANKYSTSAFDRDECLEGIHSFFEDVYPELCCEMPKLAQHMSKEMLPMLREVFSAGELNPKIPQKLRSA